jgi:hypothetical protein
MPETLYAILKSGDVKPISGVTALAIDNTLTIKPGDFYRNEWIVQEDDGSPLLVTKQKGDQTGSPQALRDESWVCSHWKFTRGVSLPIIYLPWTEVEAICSAWPDQPVSGGTRVHYVTLRSGLVAPITYVDDDPAAITPNSNLTINPGDYYRNEYIEQSNISANPISWDLLGTNMFGDARDGDALNSESWGCSHYAFARDNAGALLTLYIPWIHVAGISPEYPNVPV